MNDNLSEEVSCLNPVNITSNVRAPGEYKYYYCGENNSASDKSFLTISTVWYTTKIPEELILLSSCYTKLYTCYLYYCPKNKIYNIIIYTNILDYKSENITLKPIKLIHLEHSYKQKDIVIEPPNKTKPSTYDKPTINITVKIYFASDNYLILNEVDRRIILIDFFNGNYTTIFSNQTSNTQEALYNIIDTYDENYFLKGEQRIRTYAFLSVKYQEKKTSFYKYRYFIIDRGIIRNKYFFLHNIDLDMGNGEPFGLKITKIPKISKSSGKKDKHGENVHSQWFYIFCFASAQRLFQLVTNYDSLNLYQTLRNIHQCNTISVPTDENKNKCDKSSMTIIGFKKDNKSDNNNNNDNKTNINNPKKICFWSTSIVFKLQTKQIGQSIKIFININTKQLCALIIFFETGAFVIFPFNYTDPPEEIKNKIIVISKEIQLDNVSNTNKDLFNPLAKVYKFKIRYFFKSNTICALTSKNLILAFENKFRIYDLETNNLLYSYDFYKESISSFLLFDDIGFTFLLTWNKIFKIIFNTRHKLFSSNEIKYNSKVKINPYIVDKEKMNYPLFEYNPEDIWNSYCDKLDIENENNDDNVDKKICQICSNQAKYYCSDCESKYYCCYEHFRYDYNYTHFFECQFIQFFKRNDIISIEDNEIRYIILYNELIKLCGRILNYMFTRIFVSKNCHIFLEMLINLINLLDNFGFYENLAEFCTCNLIYTNDKRKKKLEKILFFQECIYYYVQLQILKCTFTLKCRLFNLTDCYMKIIKNDIIPKLTPKTNRRLMALRCENLVKESIFHNEFFSNFPSSVFFDFKKIYDNAEGLDYINILRIYLMKHLMALSILVKFKIKLNSSIDVKDTFVDISLMFDDHFRDSKTCKNVVPYCYFSISFYLVEIGKVGQSVKLLKKTANSFTEKSDINLKALTFYNLGILQYALGEFKIGIHNLETAYKLGIFFNLSEKFKNKVMMSLSLAYLNQRNLFKSYVLIQKTIRELKQIRKQKYELKCIKLNAYLNYIIDLYEYTFITMAKNKNINKKIDNRHELIDFVQGDFDKQLIVVEQYVDQFLKVVEFIWDLPPEVLQNLEIDNPPKQTTNYKEEAHQEKNMSFSMDLSQMNTFMMRENNVEKEESQEEYDEDVEVKPTLFDSLTRKQQKEFKELKSIFLKRDIILRDSLGAIEKFNINYDPVYSIEFKKIIEKLKNNFLLKEIFYYFRNEKWRDELYNYSSNSVLFGLSKYLKLEKIKNVISIEKSKCLDKIKKEKNIFSNQDLLQKINMENNIYPNNAPNNNLSLFSDYKSSDMTYSQFKERFAKSLKENEKTKNYDKLKYFNLKDDYLLNLYKTVYLNNPEHDFIFENPLLILNYIFIDISNDGMIKKEDNEFISNQKIEEDKEKNEDKIILDNFDIIKEEEPENPQILNNNNLTSNDKNNSNIFDNRTKLIVSPVLQNNININNSSDVSDNNIEKLEDNSDNANNDEENNSSNTYIFNEFIYLKYENIADNLSISKESEIFYIFMRKRQRSSTSKVSDQLLYSFGKKKGNERRSILPALFMRFSSRGKIKKENNLIKKLKERSTSEKLKLFKNRKGSAITQTLKKKSINMQKNKKKKKEKSSCNLRERLSIKFNNEMGIIFENIKNRESSSEEEEEDDLSKSSNNIHNNDENDVLDSKNDKKDNDNNIKEKQNSIDNVNHENNKILENENNVINNENNDMDIYSNKENVTESNLSKNDIGEDSISHYKVNNTDKLNHINLNISNDNESKKDIKKKIKIINDNEKNNKEYKKANSIQNIDKNNNINNYFNKNEENENVSNNNINNNIKSEENLNNENDLINKINNNNKISGNVEDIKRSKMKNKTVNSNIINLNIMEKLNENINKEKIKSENNKILNDYAIQNKINIVSIDINENKKKEGEISSNNINQSSKKQIKDKKINSNKVKTKGKHNSITTNNHPLDKEQLKNILNDALKEKEKKYEIDNKVNIPNIKNNQRYYENINNIDNSNSINNTNIKDSEENINISNYNNFLLELNEGQEISEISMNSKRGIKHSEKKINKNKKIRKNKSVIHINNSITSLISDNKKNSTIKNKILSISSKKLLTKPKSYNVFCQYKYFNNNNNNKIDIGNTIYPNTQRKPIKNYGFKNKSIQESEILNGAMMYLQNEYYNRNKNKNIKDNHIFNSSGITMRELQHKLNIFENNVNVINKNNYKVPYDYKKVGKQFGEESTTSLNSTSTGIFLLNNISNYGDESSIIDNNCDVFQKEMNRIINFNKKMKNIEKDNCIRNNKNNLRNNKVINKSNKKMKKSSSQPFLYNNKNIKMFNYEEKSNCNKNNNSSKKKKNLSDVEKNKNNEQSDLSRNINELKYNLKSQQIKKSNISNTNTIINKELIQKNIVDNYQDENNFFKKKQKEKINKNRIKDNQSNENKFRFVLDKYTKKQKESLKKNSNKKKQKEKFNTKTGKNKEKQNNFIPRNDKVINNGINNDSFFNEGLNLENIYDINALNEKNKKNEINLSINSKNKINLLEIENLNLSTIKKKDDSTQNINNISKMNVKNSIKDNNDNIIKKISFETLSCNALDEENNIKEKKNIPLNISPIIKYSEKKNQFLLNGDSNFSYSLNIQNNENNHIDIVVDSNINSNYSEEIIKSINQENRSSNKKNISTNIDNILGKIHDKPKFFKINEKK